MDTPQMPTEMPKLDDPRFFPVFEALPIKYKVNLAYHGTNDGRVYRPRAHWCFLGEIVQHSFFLRLSILVRDGNGKSIPITFYTSEHGSSLVRNGEVKIGYTAAVLYAEQHGFVDSTVGICQQALQTIKVFPVSMDGLMQLSDRLQKYATVDKDETTCHNCQRKAASLLRCAKCNLFSYCNKDCQVEAWHHKGHKADCKLLKDADFRSLLLLQWDCFQDFHQFSPRT
ncbi:hypothetical protein XA68_10248 [Ophiocordyceps unilateralis]|uniref:MYND-type domain-containing protein n=1 Tax=Ophiocordyceps unilateralis TaxID=268505 RepID=A0A2A9PII2_OPHUN|nr:hypothetical protein XA68_10248 [Ophiocordyceps unilateralis]